MSDSEEGGEQYELVAGADEGEGEATDDESLSSALKLLQTPTAAPGAAADAAPAPARAEEEEPSECGRAEVRRRESAAGVRLTRRTGYAGARGLRAQLSAPRGPGGHVGSVRDGVV